MFLRSAFSQRNSKVKTELERIMEQLEYELTIEEISNPRQEKERLSKRPDHLFSLVIDRFNKKNKVKLNFYYLK